MLGLLEQTLHKHKDLCTGSRRTFPWGWPRLGLGDSLSRGEKHWPWTPRLGGG